MILFVNKQSVLLEKGNQINTTQSKFVIKDIICGGNHTDVLNTSGRVYTFGHNMNGQLGLGDTKNHCLPEIVKSVLKKKVSAISAGWSHTLILTDQGNFYSCGSAKFGELYVVYNL